MYVTLFWSFFTFVTYPGNYMMWTRRYIRNVRQLYVTAYLLPPPFIKQQRSSFIKLFSIHLYSKRFTSRWFGEVFVLRFSDKTYKPLKFIKRVHLRLHVIESGMIYRSDKTPGNCRNLIHHFCSSKPFTFR